MDLLGRLFAEDREEANEAAAADKPRVALFVDGPNVLRDEFDVDLDDVREAAAAAGQLTALRLYLDEHATPGLIQAAEARGFEVVVTSGDVDVRLAVDVTRFAVEDRADVIAIASRDTDFKPAIETANAYGRRTFAIAPGEFGRSDALRNAATERVTLEGDADDGPTLVGYDT
ncbi:NYN domain-containing protein [Halobellus sp. GM3]|uniref:NYN domain-containing protein n=1 Tax=Halobellus sp. GM3 TaxID=3458410 RepID=UPI00403E0626